MSEKSERMRSSNSSCGRLAREHRPHQPVEVGAGREVAAGAGEDGHPHVGVAVDHVPGVAQPAEHLGVEGVALVGAVQGDGDDVAVALDEHCGFAHVRSFRTDGFARRSGRPHPSQCPDASSEAGRRDHRGQVSTASDDVDVDELNPLVEIERRVQARAKDLAHDMHGPDGDRGLQALIADEIDQWSDDFKRGLRPFDLAAPDEVAERAFRNLARYGPLTPLLDDRDVWEIMINSPIGHLREAPRRARRATTTRSSTTASTSPARSTKLLDDASTSHRKLDPAEGLQDAQLDDGSRLHIVHADVSRGGHPMVNIRRFTGVAFHSLDQLVERDMLAEPGRPLPRRLRAGRPLDRVRRRPRLGQDDPAVVLRGRARPGQARRHRRGGLRGRRPARQRGAACRPGRRGPTGPRSTCDGSCRASCAWPPTWPSSARSATARRCRCCSRCRRASPGSPPSTPARPARPSPGCGSCASSPTRANDIPMSALNSLVSEADRSGRVLPAHAGRSAGRGDRRGRGPGRRAGGHPVHRHRAVRPSRPRRTPAVDGQPAGAGRPGVRRRRHRPRRPSSTTVDGLDLGVVLTALLLAVAAGYGVHLVFTALAFRWRGVGPGPSGPDRGPHVAASHAAPAGAATGWPRPASATSALGEFAAVIAVLSLLGAGRWPHRVRRRPPCAGAGGVRRVGAGRDLPTPPCPPTRPRPGRLAPAHRRDPHPHRQRPDGRCPRPCSRWAGRRPTSCGRRSRPPSASGCCPPTSPAPSTC